MRHAWIRAVTGMVLLVAGAAIPACGGASATGTVSSPTGSTPVATSATSSGSSTDSAGTSATSSRPPGSSASAAATPVGGADLDWLNWHRTAGHTGLDVADPPITPSAVRRQWQSADLDGAIYGEALVDGDTVVVATEGGSVYGLDLATGTQRWRTHVADPVAQTSLPCGDIDPIGITATPVIDKATHTLAVVAERAGSDHVVATMSDVDGSNLTVRRVDPPESQQLYQQSRAALALRDGRVIIGLGGRDGDCGPYHGYVVSVPLVGPGDLTVYTVPSAREAGVWATGGPVVDPAGAVIAVTGNGDSSDSFDHGNTVVRLDAALHETGYFAPDNWAELNAQDQDLGSTGPTILDDGRVLVAGKDGMVFALDPEHLAGIGASLGRVQLGGGVFGGMAAGGGMAFLPATSGLTAVSVGGPGLVKVWQGPRTWTPIVAGGAVWAVTRDGGRLEALDLHDGHELAGITVGQVEHFVSPSAARGHVLVPAGNHVVSIGGV